MDPLPLLECHEAECSRLPGREVVVMRRRARVESAQWNDGVSTAWIPLVARPRRRVELPSGHRGTVRAHKLAERAERGGASLKRETTASR